MLVGGEDVRQDRGQPFNSLLSCVLLQSAEQPLSHFRFITENLFHLIEMDKDERVSGDEI